LPADAPEGFAELALTAGGLELIAPVYVSGAKLEGFRKLLAEARAALEKADGMSCEDAKSLHWGSAPPGYPEKRDPNEFTALFGGKYNVIYGERLLAAAAKRCSVLESVPDYERDLRYRLERLRAGKRPERGILWKAYRSRFDGAPQPYSMYVPEDYDPAKKYPLVIDLHGYSGGWNLKPGQDKVRAARELGCLLLKPYLRGMTWYMAWGESEMLDLLKAVRSEYSVDPDRIHVSGFSMGGCGTMKFLASYPDVFASGGGSSGRAEPMGAERTGVTPSWTADGFKDQGTPWTGGRMFALHAAEVEPVSARHRGDAFTGHGYLIDRVSLYSWLLAHPMDRWPKRLRFTVWSARFASLRWVREVEPERYGRMVRIVADARDGKVHLDTENAAGLRLALSGKLVAAGEPLRVVWNGRETELPAGSREVRLGSLTEERPARRKRPNELAGPIEDFLIRKFVIVRGTGKGAAKGIADGVKYIRERWQHSYQAQPDVHDDTKAPREVLAANHLLCVGTETTNGFLREHAAKLPVRVGGGRIRIGRRSTPAAGAKYWFLTLNPLNPDRYMLVVGADRPKDTARALRPLISKPFRHFDYAVYGERAARPRSERTARFAKLMGISAFGWFDRDWKVYPRDPLLPDCEFMDNQNPSLVLTPDGEWRPGCEPELRRAKD
ncbi:MAG: carboxylesterase family protein, partial [Planctomycetota bacterium]